jgi:hypothetical protein
VEEEEGVATRSEEGVGGLAAGNARHRRRRWPVGRLPREVRERREEGGGGSRHVGHDGVAAGPA